MFEEIAWAIAETKDAETPIVFRFRQFPKDFSKARYPQRLNVFWQIDSPSNGMPRHEESERLSNFEDNLIEATEHDGQSVLSIVLTGKGEREFVFHTDNPQEFVRRLTEMPQEKE